MQRRWPLNLATPFLLGIVGCAQTQTDVKRPDLSGIKRDPWVIAASFEDPARPESREHRPHASPAGSAGAVRLPTAREVWATVITAREKGTERISHFQGGRLFRLTTAQEMTLPGRPRTP